MNGKSRKRRSLLNDENMESHKENMINLKVCNSFLLEL